MRSRVLPWTAEGQLSTAAPDPKQQPQHQQRHLPWRSRNPPEDDKRSMPSRQVGRLLHGIMSTPDKHWYQPHAGHRGVLIGHGQLQSVTASSISTPTCHHGAWAQSRSRQIGWRDWRHPHRMREDRFCTRQVEAPTSAPDAIILLAASVRTIGSGLGNRL